MTGERSQEEDLEGATRHPSNMENTTTTRIYVGSRFDNDLPTRSRTVRLFTQFPFQGVEDIVKVFTALGFNIKEDIVCFHKVADNCYLIAFKSAELKKMCLEMKEQFLNFVEGEALVIQDVERQYEFITLSGAPYEMPDELLRSRLNSYGTVKQIWRGKHKFEPLRGIENGFRHAYISLDQNVVLPAYLRFGSQVIRIRANSNQNVCQRCNEEGHSSTSCRQIICFNCDKAGHRAINCPAVRMCVLCKSHLHSARYCGFNWNLIEEVVNLSGKEASKVREIENGDQQGKEMEESEKETGNGDQGEAMEGSQESDAGYTADEDESDESCSISENDRSDSERETIDEGNNLSDSFENVSVNVSELSGKGAEADITKGKPKRRFSDIELSTDKKLVWADGNDAYVTYADKVSSSRKKYKSFVSSPDYKTD